MPPVVKKNRKQTLSRQEKIRRNPIPWVVVYIICIGILYFIYGDIGSWLSKRSEIGDLEPSNAQMETRKKTVQAKKAEVETQFNDQAAEFLREEKQLFPEHIDTSRIAQIIEIYSILLQRNSSSSSVVELSSLNVGLTTPAETANFDETPLNLSLTLDKVSFKKYIKFLQDGKVADELRNRVISRKNKGDAASIEFLENNRLPIMSIRSINMTEDRSSVDRPLQTYNVQMQVVLYSRSQQ